MKTLNHEKDLLSYGYNAHVYHVETVNGCTFECFIEINTARYMIAMYDGDTLLFVADDDETGVM